MEAKIRKIIEGWFIYDNALFEISLTHALRANTSMRCPMRCGDGRIEYNPEILRLLSDRAIESLLKIECVRIILKHPYERQPIGCSPAVRLVTSGIIIGDNYELEDVKLPKSSDYGMPKNESYEWYAYRLQEDEQQIDLSQLMANAAGGGDGGADSDGSGDGDDDDTADAAADYTALWHEDSFMTQYIDLVITKIEQTKNWGTMPGDLVQHVIADSRGRIDYRKVLSGFRMNITSSKRHLTRMRPNRRTGFDNMGSIRSLCTRLLVAVDVSSSVSDASLGVFFSVVNRAFRHGIETLDLVTFDTVIHDVMEYRRGRSKVVVTGRGGTNFQPAIDYAHEHGYDGLMVFTDGEALLPQMPDNPRFKVVWVFDTLAHYNEHHERLGEIGRCCPIEY